MDKSKEIALRVGNTIKDISKNSSKANIARIMSLEPPRISKIIKGNSSYLSYYQLYQLNIVLGVDLNELITGKHNEMRNEITGDNITSIQIQASENEIKALNELVKVQREMIKMLREKLKKYEPG